ncbi:App1 family protein [soil metagenome]
MVDTKIKLTEKKFSRVQRLKRKFLFWLRLTDQPVIRVYNSYGNNTHLIIHGHVLKFGPLPRKRYRKFFLTNMFAVIRSFIVVPWKNVQVLFEWGDQTYEAYSEKDGFFRFEVPPEKILSPGWYPIKIKLGKNEKQVETSGTGEIYIPYPYQHAFISDIDDTFLISHSSNLRKRLYALFTKNAKSRKPFEGVVNHYQLLAANNAAVGTFNPFFYVSSSEWNLYELIEEFSQTQKLPRGAFLLNQLKRFHQVLKTGQNNHKTKFMRIVRVIEAYPKQQYILLGDNSQEDPNIYLSLAEYFPQKIFAVYLRNISERKTEATQQIVDQINAKGIPCCFFVHSSEAIEHSKIIGLIENTTIFPA